MASQKSIKKRYWAFIVYPESAPSDWLNILQVTGLPVAISPLHDKDKNDGDGSPKKPHYHCIATYSGPTTFNCVKSLTDKLNAPIPIPLESVRGNYRYFTHKDNPDKFQYEEKDISTLNGFNIADFVELTKSEVHAIVMKLEKLIREHDFIEYADVAEYLTDNDMISEHDVFSSHTIHFNALIRSRRHRKLNSTVSDLKIDSETGEVIG